MQVRTGVDKKKAFVEALQRSKPLLLDGGLATQLETQGCDLGNTLWSASLLPAMAFKTRLTRKLS